MEEVVEDVRALVSSGGDGTHANEPAHEVRYPLKEEESKSFQASGKLLSAAQGVRLAEQYQKDYDR